VAMGTIQGSWFLLQLLVKKIALFHKFGVGVPGRGLPTKYGLLHT
jgi:hypothetical protein